MQITSLSIKNILGLEALELALTAPINLIVGENESGKSSLRDSIQWCLTGQARGLKIHQDQAYLIREGAKAAEVTISLADGRAIARKKTPKTPASVTGTVPGDQVMASILCDPLTFLSWPDDKRREILFSLIPGLNPTREEIAKRLSLACDEPKEGPLRKCILDLAKMAASKGFKDAKNEAVTRRRIAKRVRDDAKVDSGNRNGDRFVCCYCGYEDHADRVGAMNLRGRLDDPEIIPFSLSIATNRSTDKAP